MVSRVARQNDDRLVGTWKILYAKSGSWFLELALTCCLVVCASIAKLQGYKLENDRCYVFGNTHATEILVNVATDMISPSNAFVPSQQLSLDLWPQVFLVQLMPTPFGPDLTSIPSIFKPF